VMLGKAASRHTVVVPLMLPVGKGLTITVALPVCDCTHAVLLAS
jgi:hypothetical protein